MRFLKPKPNHKVMMSEGPTVVGMMAVAVESGGSLDTAVRDVASNGPINIARSFRDIVDRADVRAVTSIKDALSLEISSYPRYLTPLRRAIHMIIAASESSDGKERDRMLKDASQISVTGLKEAGEEYGSALSTPCMVVFALGIMVPMVLMSILPMLNIGGIFGSSTIGSLPITVMTLIGIPAVIISVTLSIREKNPFMTTSVDGKDVRALFPLLSSIPIGFVVWNITSDVVTSVVAGCCAGGALTFMLMFPEMNGNRLTSKRESMLKDAVFELGNRLISGENFEQASVSAVGAQKECIGLADSLSMELALCRGDGCRAIRYVIAPVSPRIAEIFCDVYRCSLKDLRDAGRLAIAVGRQLQDQDSARKVINNKLKSMVDMMSATAAVFAPLVLGMSVSMLGPLSELSEGIDMDGTAAVLSIYLAELCVLISYLTSNLRGTPGFGDVAYRAGMMLPVSLIIFSICMRFSF